MKNICRLLGILLAGGLLQGCGPEEMTQLDIFYTADVEGFYWTRPEPRLANRETGGYSVLKSFLDRQREPFLLFDGGNWFGSAPEGTMTQGAYVTQLASTLPYSAASVSDKDFVFGWPSLRGIIRELPYPFLVANLKLDNQIPWPLHDYHIFTKQDIKIGVFGLISPQGMAQNKTRLSGFSVQDPVQTAREMVALLQSKGVDVIVVLSSLGETEFSGSADVVLAEEVPGIHLILSSNKDRENAETDEINNTYIVYPGSRLDSVVRLRLSIDKTKQLKNIQFEDIYLFKDDFGENEEIAQKAGALLEQTRHKMNARITQNPQEMVPALAQESELGDLLTDCLYKWSKLDGAVLNSDSIRASLPQGVLTEYDLYKTYPYGDNITFLTIKGAAFKQALEASLNVTDNFPQIAGFTVMYDPKAPEGEKIKRITLLNGRIVRPQETYRFAVTDHILAGGFGHDEFINALEFKNTFVEARQIMRSCLSRKKTVESPKMGRWQVIK